MIIKSIYLLVFSTLFTCFAEKQIDSTRFYHPNLGKKICMEDLGCFEITKEFFDTIRRPINVLPLDRKIIDAVFKLYQRDAPSEPKIINTYKPKSIENSPIDPTKKIIIIVHGWIDQDFGPWQERLKDRILLNEDCNVIVVDWTKGNKPPYTQATANTRVVGAEIALLVNLLEEKRNIDPRNVHIIGHSLGAQIAGYAGERIKHLGRITGLDPAEPYFQYMPPMVRLDETDAEFVDVIHTDSNSILLLGFGMEQPCGHVDFYPNNGRNQPGCEKRGRLIKLITEGIIEGGGRFVGCNHQRAVEFYASTVTQKKCLPVGYKCSSWDNFLEGKCTDCGPDGSMCAAMGEKAYLSKGLGQKNLKLYLKMGKDRPYCLYHYKIVVKLHKVKDSRKMRGKLEAVIYGEETDASQTLTPHDVDLVPGSRHVYMFTTDKDLGNIQSVSISWKPHLGDFLNPFNWLKNKKINIKYVQLVPMNVIQKEEKLAQTKTFCQSDPDKAIKPGQPAVHILSNKCELD
ncbi:pancreatic lipase-related protein 2-like [Centruroides vittatus]|uniref:pancreatic lipase-related protein 2-like n=1 Tax=Centruroides vittatus TaxID=120091 RepID=UPI00350FAB4C